MKALSISFISSLPHSITIRGGMDVDIPDVAIEDIGVSQFSDTQLAKAEDKKPIVVPVDDAHPFNVESYISSYSSALYKSF